MECGSVCEEHVVNTRFIIGRREAVSSYPCNDDGCKCWCVDESLGKCEKYDNDGYELFTLKETKDLSKKFHIGHNIKPYSI